MHGSSSRTADFYQSLIRQAEYMRDAETDDTADYVRVLNFIAAARSMISIDLTLLPEFKDDLIQKLQVIQMDIIDELMID